MNIRRVVLTGFMGSGKSTVGPLLADALGWNFVDVDQEIESRSGASASFLFQTLGEAAFRGYEFSVMSMCLDTTETVIALGGAAVDLDIARRLLSVCNDCWIVFLDGPFDVLIARCLSQEGSGDATYRPLLRDREAALAHYAIRREWNREIAQQIIDVSRSAGEAIAASIVNRLLP